MVIVVSDKMTADSTPNFPAPVLAEGWHEGWYAAARRVDSPNQDARPEADAPSLLVIHAISLPPGQFGGPEVEALFTNQLDPTRHPYFAQIADLRVSAHFFIRRTGELVQFVPCSRRAWHAGASHWQGRERCNDFSVGIEMEGADDQPFTEPQYRALNTLIAALKTVYPSLLDIAGHSDIAPGRKTDPGPCFDWGRVKR
jgi:AmpD protein